MLARFIHSSTSGWTPSYRQVAPWDALRLCRNSPIDAWDPARKGVRRAVELQGVPPLEGWDRYEVDFLVVSELARHGASST